MRICNKCRQDKSLSEFHRKNIGKFGRTAVCKECANLAKKEKRRMKHPPRIRIPRTPHRTKMLMAVWKKKNRVKVMIHAAKQRAKLRGMSFDITAADIELPKFCPVLGIELGWEGLKHSREAREKAPSIDRIDNSKGYTKDNVIVISTRANCIKRDASLSELQRIAEFYTRLAARIVGQFGK